MGFNDFHNRDIRQRNAQRNAELIAGEIRSLREQIDAQGRRNSTNNNAWFDTWFYSLKPHEQSVVRALAVSLPCFAIAGFCTSLVVESLAEHVWDGDLAVRAAVATITLGFGWWVLCEGLRVCMSRHRSALVALVVLASVLMAATYFGMAGAESRMKLRKERGGLDGGFSATGDSAKRQRGPRR